MRISSLFMLALIAPMITGCASKPPTPILIPSESQVDQGKAEPEVMPVK